ncbi:MAG: hypothetical protein KBS85_02385 [Lachnospiraceae bacterium]|nr:hypothetical protein [Candidatus Merdinaster equi]
MKVNIREICIFGMFGALMYASKILMEFLPNVHLIGVFIVALTAVYRQKALYSLYVFVFLVGLFNGFNTWWVPYLYIWTVLWGFAMLIPRKLSPKIRFILYPVCCSLHGFLFGTLYAPFQAFAFGLSFEGMIAWIIAGLPWDVVHGVSNLIGGSILIYPLVKVTEKLKRITS